MHILHASTAATTTWKAIQYMQDKHMDEKGIPLPDEWELGGHAPVGYDTPLLQNGSYAIILVAKQ
jgi:hypothetical protein